MNMRLLALLLTKDKGEAVLLYTIHKDIHKSQPHLPWLKSHIKLFRVKNKINVRETWETICYLINRHVCVYIYTYTYQSHIPS